MGKFLCQISRWAFFSKIIYQYLDAKQNLVEIRYEGTEHFFLLKKEFIFSLILKRLLGEQRLIIRHQICINLVHGHCLDLHLWQTYRNRVKYSKFNQQWILWALKDFLTPMTLKLVSPRVVHNTMPFLKSFYDNLIPTQL